MDITAVTSTVDDLGAAEHFYGTTLALPVRREAEPAALVVTVGSSRLRLRHAPGEPVCDHLAFTIPADAVAPAKQWLRARVPLLSLDGQEEFEGPRSWESRSVYFSGPSGAVLELIGRRRLPYATSSATFDAQQLLAISEVGVAVSDVPAAVAQLADMGLAVLGEASSDFAAVGDDHGLLVLARAGRPWLPTRDRLARSSPLAVEAVGPVPGPLLVGGAALLFTE